MNLGREHQVGIALMLLGASLAPFMTDLSFSAVSGIVGLLLFLHAQLFRGQEASRVVLQTSAPDEWKQLAQRFDKVDHRIWADWFSEGLDFEGKPHGEFWTIRGDGMDTKECEALCRLAGVLLSQTKGFAMSEQGTNPH